MGPTTANRSRKRCCLGIQEPHPQKWGPLMLLLQLRMNLTIQSLPVGATALLILPNSTTDLGNLREERTLAALQSVKGPRPLQHHTAIILTSLTSGITGAVQVPLGSSVTTRGVSAPGNPAPVQAPRRQL